MSRTEEVPNCRLVLLNPPGQEWREIAERTREALGGGDIASILLWQSQLNEDDFQRLCETLVPDGQEAGIAMIVAGETRIARRVGADGIHAEKRADLACEAERADGLILGAGGVKTRHEALELGELRPDYMLFGRPGYDTHPEPHPRNLSLAQWWSEMVEIPCIVLAGSSMESVQTAAGTGAEFVAASAAIFNSVLNPAEAVREANRLLADARRPDRVEA